MDYISLKDFIKQRQASALMFSCVFGKLELMKMFFQYKGG